MALINTLREKAGKVLIIAVGFAIVSFMLADLLGPNSMIFGGQSNDVGEIAGRKITYEDYQQRIENMKNNYMLNTGRSPSEAEMNTLRQQAWELLIVDIAFQDEYDELGLNISREEKIDMVQGNNVHPDLVRAFTNPETGQFDKSQITNFLRNFSQLPPENQRQWEEMEKSIYQSRNRLKYDNLLLETNYITDAEAQQKYQAENTTAEVKYLYIPYYAVSDSAVSVTDSELKSYIDDHQQEYQVEESRSVKYISIPIAASAQDSAAFETELSALIDDFQSVANDSSFARLNTDNLDVRQAYSTYNTSELPEALQNQYEQLEEGEVYGPFIEDGIYSLYKVSEIFEDTVSSARASHILFRAEEGNSEERQAARQEAQETLSELNAGANFAATAIAKSDDGSASRGGDLGWFAEGNMVAPFEEAVFGANTTGLINRLIETQFGYHIINVTAVRTNNAYKIATIQREIGPSDDTRDQAYRRADYLAGMSDDIEEFQQNAQEDSLQVLEAENITSDARRIGSLSNAREVVRWLFRDASKGSVSEVFELDDAYIVAAMSGKIEKGTAPLSMVREEVTAKVKNQKKGQLILEKLSGLSGSLEEIATAYGDDAKVHTSSDLKMNSNSLPSVGVAPKAVGVAFGLEAGERSEPVLSENGALILETIAVNKAPEIADYSSYKTNLKQIADNRTSFEISEAIKEFAEIEDKRYRFY